MEKIDRSLALALIEAELTALLLMVPMYKRMGLNPQHGNARVASLCCIHASEPNDSTHHHNQVACLSLALHIR